MPDDDEFKIQLRVAEKIYRLTCKRSDEGLFRKAATDINDKMLQYSSRFSGAKFELKDLLAMAAIHISVENQDFKRKEDISPLWKKIEILDDELEKYLEMVQPIRLN